MAPSPWLLLSEYLISFSAQIFVFYVFSTIIFKRQQTTVITSPSIMFYFCTQIIAAFISALYTVFLLTGWRPYPVEYNSYILFYIGICMNLASLLSPIAVFALGLDRCLCVIFPLKYSKRENAYPVYFGILLMSAVATLSALIILAPAYPTKPTTFCTSFGCTSTMSGQELYVQIRYFTSALILTTSVILLIMMKRKLHLFQNKTKKLNVLVFYTMVTTMILDFLPHLLFIISYSILDINLTAYTGPYATVTSALESGFCAFLYNRVYKQPITNIKSKSINTIFLKP